MKKFLVIFFGLIVLIMAGLTVFILTFDLNSYRDTITAKISESVGRPVQIGSLEMKLSLIPTIKVRNVVIENPDRFEAKQPLLRVDSLDATLAIAPLLSKRVEVQAISLGNVDVYLVDKGGINNWTMGSSNRKSNSISADSFENTENNWLSQMRIDTISAKNLKLTYNTPQSEQSVTLTDLTINQLKVFSLKVLLADIPVQISGTVNNILDLVMQKPDYLFNLNIAGANMEVKVSGSVGNTQSFKDILLNLDMSGDSLKQTFSTLKLSDTAVPAQAFALSSVFQGDLKNMQMDKFVFTLGGNKMRIDLKGNIQVSPIKMMADGNIQLSDRSLGQFWGVQPFLLELDMSASPSEIQLNKFNLTANRSDLSVLGKIRGLSGKPDLVLNVNSEYLDLQDLLQSESSDYATGNKTSGKKTTVIPDTPINLSALDKINANITFSFPHLNMTGAFNDYLGMNGVLLLKNGNMTIKPMNVSLLKGMLSGSVYVQSDNNMTLQLSGSNLQLNDVKGMAGFVKDASVDAALSLKASGKSVKELLSTLTGQISLEIPQGTIVNPWFNGLAEKLGTGKKHSVSYSKTDAESKIVCGAVNLDLKNGQIKSANNMAIETSSINFMVGGEVDLSQETLDLNMIPSVNTQENKVNDILATAGQFIKIKGTFAHMEPSIDAGNAVQGLLKLAQKKSQAVEPYQLCSAVLGRRPKAQILSEAKKNQMLPEPKPVSLEPSKSVRPATFEEQLMDAVSKALQK